MGHGNFQVLDRILTFAIMALLTAPMAVAATNALKIYPVPRQLLYSAHNDDFTVRVRTPGGEWQDLYEYRIRVDTDTLQNASLVYFDFAGTVEVEIEKNNGSFSHASLAPLSVPIKLTRHGSVVHFTLTKPERFSVQFDDDRLHNLHILAGSLPTPPPQGANVRVFEPGLHNPPEGRNTFPIQSGEQIYLKGGAILHGSFDLTGLHDVKISGRGFIYDPGRPIDLNGSSNIDISDLILFNSEKEAGARVMNIRNSQNVTVHDISGFTSGKWSDGINISTSQHITVDGGYLRVSDDAVVVYAVTDCPICGDKPIAPIGPPGAVAPAETFDINIRNLTIWNDVAHAMFVGHFGDNTAPRSIHDVTFDNIDVANLDEDDPDWEGVLAIFSGDSTQIRNITFSNIRVDRIEEGKLINIVAGNNPRYNKAPGGGIDGVTLRNISFTGDGMPGKSILRGLSETTTIKNVTIENLRIGRKKIRSAAEGNMEVGDFVSGLKFQ